MKGERQIMLTFLGRGSGFSDNHNCAFFIHEDSLVLIDCSIMAFLKMKNAGIDKFSDGKKINRIVIMITHTHSDHIAGLPMLVHFSYFVWKLPIEIIVSSNEVKENIEYYLINIDGCAETAFNVCLFEDKKGKEGYEWLLETIPTSHVPQLSGKCFGYKMKIEGKSVVYTGDTRCIEDFIPYLDEGGYLYSECSAIDSGVHTPIWKLTEYKDFFREKKIKVYLMHLDDEDKIKKAIEGTDFEFAPLF